jgi:hypothetical protein
MADVNALYPQAPAPAQPAANLMNDPAKVMGLIGQLNQNALFQQSFNARKAIGSAYQEAIQPDGSIDTQALMRAIKANPDAGFMAGDAAAGALSRQGQQISNTTAQLEQHAKQQGFLIDSLGALADDPKLNYDKVRNVAVTYARNLKLPGEMVNAWLYGLPKDQKGLRESLIQMRNMATGAANLSTPTPIGITPQNAPITGTRGQFNYGSAGGNTAGNGGPGIVTAPAPGVAEAQVQTGVGSANAYTAASEAAGNYGQRINPLRQAIPILEKMKETDIGPTSERWNDIKSTAVSLGAGKLAGIDPDKIKDFNELNKYFKQYSAQVGATMGPKTNDGLATAVTSNPNVNMDKLSALELSKVALGVERMKQAGVLEFNAKVDRGEAIPADFNKFMVNWGTRQDPRAFVYDLMTKEQQEKLKKTLPPTELKKIRDGMNIADRHGLIGDVHHNE